MKCPYCQRPLRGIGIRCRACQRYVLGWMHYIVLIIVGLVVSGMLLELFLRF